MTDDEYWQATCQTCRAEGRIHTNLDCVKEIAETTGTPLYIAMHDFRPQPGNPPVAYKHTWQKGP
jgi:hypothetical protein